MVFSSGFPARSHRFRSCFLHLFFEVFDPDPGLNHGACPCHQALPGIPVVNQLPFHDVMEDETFLDMVNEDVAKGLQEIHVA